VERRNTMKSHTFTLLVNTGIWDLSPKNIKLN
jgi:hypothetical protein